VYMCMRGRACTHNSMKFETNRRWNSDEIQLRKTVIPCSCNIKIRECIIYTQHRKSLRDTKISDANRSCTLAKIDFRYDDDVGYDALCL